MGNGWSTIALGDTVRFFSFIAEPHLGSFTLSGATTAVAAFVEDIAGVAPTDSWIKQTEWSEDNADGNTTLPVLDYTKGNIYQIRYQWLGYGLIEFALENPSTGKIEIVHKMEYANKNTLPTINNPTLPICYMVMNTTNNTDIVVNSASCGGFVEGRTNGAVVRHGVSVTKSGITTESPVLTIHNPLIYQGVPNRTRVRIKFMSVSVDGTKNAIIRILVNPTLTNGSFSDLDAGKTVIKYDTSASVVSGGDELFGIGMAKVDSEILSLAEDKFELNPGEFLTITGESSSSTEITASFNFEDRF